MSGTLLLGVLCASVAGAQRGHLFLQLIHLQVLYNNGALQRTLRAFVIYDFRLSKYDFLFYLRSPREIGKADISQSKFVIISIDYLFFLLSFLLSKNIQKI